MCVGVGGGGACVSPWFFLSVVETQSVETTIVGSEYANLSVTEI